MTVFNWTAAVFDKKTIRTVYNLTAAVFDKKTITLRGKICMISYFQQIPGY